MSRQAIVPFGEGLLLGIERRIARTLAESGVKEISMKRLLTVACAALLFSLLVQAVSAVTAQEEQRENYSAAPAFDLVIPEGPVPPIRRNFIQMSGGPSGGNFQYFAEFCVDAQAAVLTEDAFKAKFTAWSNEGAAGILLYPEGPAFKVLAGTFTEVDGPVSYTADEAHYLALILCFFPTVVFGVQEPSEDDKGSFKVFLIPELGEEFAIHEATTVNGEIYMWKHYDTGAKFGLRIEITPSPTGRFDFLLGGRLGTPFVPGQFSP